MTFSDRCLHGSCSSQPPPSRRSWASAGRRHNSRNLILPASNESSRRWTRAAKNFHTAQANLTADQYTKVVDEKETQKGKVYYERRGNEVDMAADITEPDKQYAIYANGKAQVYNPKIDQVNEYQPGKSRSSDRSLPAPRLRRRRPRAALHLRRQISGIGKRQRNQCRQTGTDAEIPATAK